MDNELELWDSFFSSLADRLNNENDLSDVTYSVLKSDMEFKRLFLDFCFGKDVVSTNCRIIREFQKGHSRPDFTFTDENGNYLLEVKLWDCNQHFYQYVNQFPDYKRYSFIANYELVETNLMQRDTEVLQKWKCTTWSNLLKLLEQQSSLLSIIGNGYLSFLRKTIKQEKLNSMNLLEITSLLSFYNHIERIMHDCNFSDYNYSNFTRWAFGRYGQKGYVYPWFGLHYGSKIEKSKSSVVVRFEKRNNLTPIHILEKLETVVSVGTTYNLDYDDYDNQWIFSLKEELFAMLCDDNKSADEQYTILKVFFEEVCSVVEI